MMNCLDVIPGFREPVGHDWIWVLLWMFGMALIVAVSWYVTLTSKGGGAWRQNDVSESKTGKRRI